MPKEMAQGLMKQLTSLSC